MKNEASIEIDRNIEDVFVLTNDHVAEWSLVVEEDEVINETPEVVGTTFRTVTSDRGQRMEFQGVVTRHEPPHLSAIQLTGQMFDIEAEYRFVDLRGRTRVTQVAKVSGKGFFKWFMLLFGWAMNKSHCKATQAELASLKKFCEEYPPLTNGMSR